MPVWHETIDVKHIWKSEMTFPEQRDAVVATFQRSRWVKNNDTVAELVDELSEARTVAEFDYIWSYIYDEADEDRVWIATC
jgi:hypothetical protein